jgi:light-regulated signal transduction histidine kinase (bacteriophytochrome)
MNLRDLIGVLGHELRTPIAAILGYQELLVDGLYGEVQPKQREPLDRIHQSALQLVHLLDGIQELAAAGSGEADDLEATNTNTIADALLQRLTPIAEAKSVKLHFERHTPISLPLMRVQRFLRAAEIGMTAAIKKSQGRTLRLEWAHANSSVTCVLQGSALDPATDDPADFDLTSGGPAPSASRLRLAMAAATLRVAGGGVRLVPTGATSTLEFRIPVTE